MITELWRRRVSCRYQREAHCGRRRKTQVMPVCATLLLTLAIATLAGCGGPGKTKQKEGFFTSGSREADQRATQRMAKEEQLSGTGEGAGEKGLKEAKGGDQGAPAKVEGKMTLFERLGGEQGITALVEDFTLRALEDPRVNWSRQSVAAGGWFR